MGIRLRARLPALICGLWLAASCTGGGSDGPASADRPDPRLRGTVLVSTDFRSGLATVELPDGTPQEIELPLTFRVVFGSFLDDGSILAVVQEDLDLDRAYRISGGAPEPLGPPLRDRFGLTFSVEGDTLLAAGCGERPIGFVLDLTAPTAWRRVDASCGASLSPDAAAMAWSTDGRTLVRSSVDGEGEPEPILELGSIEGLSASMGGDLTIGGFGWGPDGIAITAYGGDRQAAIVTAEGSAPFVAPLGGTGPVARSILSWQPGGDLLAVMMWNNLEGIVRVLDPRTEQGRIIAMVHEPPRGMVWSPAGDVVLAATDLRWVFVAPDGEWLRSVPVARGDTLPLDWRA